MSNVVSMDSKTAERVASNLGRMQLQIEGTDIIPSENVNQIELTRYQIIDLWDNGILNNDAYVYLALRFEKEERGDSWEFDVEDFCDQWTGPPNEKGKEKRLTDVQVTSTLAKLRGLMRARVEAGPIQLSLLD